MLQNKGMGMSQPHFIYFWFITFAILFLSHYIVLGACNFYVLKIWYMFILICLGKEEERQMFQQMQAMAQKQVIFISRLVVKYNFSFIMYIWTVTLISFHIYTACLLVSFCKRAMHRVVFFLNSFINVVLDF